MDFLSRPYKWLIYNKNFDMIFLSPEPQGESKHLLLAGVDHYAYNMVYQVHSIIKPSTPRKQIGSPTIFSWLLKSLARSMQTF